MKWLSGIIGLLKCKTNDHYLKGKNQQNAVVFSYMFLLPAGSSGVAWWWSDAAAVAVVAEAVVRIVTVKEIIGFIRVVVFILLSTETKLATLLFMLPLWKIIQSLWLQRYHVIVCYTSQENTKR